MQKLPCFQPCLDDAASTAQAGRFAEGEIISARGLVSEIGGRRRHHDGVMTPPPKSFLGGSVRATKTLLLRAVRALARLAWVGAVRCGDYLWLAWLLLRYGILYVSLKIRDPHLRVPPFYRRD